MASQLALRISDVHKGYKTSFLSKEVKMALDGVSLNLYEDQIFGLLGHNGAGKSSLVSIISGITDQTSGSVRVFGYDTRTQMPRIRAMMGVCPQENVLYDKLTVREHLEVFGGLRGVDGAKLNSAVVEMMRDIDLADQENARAITLSGGQKRKLSLGMAMIGNPKVILLDEPTSGMDPYSRRKVWDLLQKRKKDHVILLTTHSMDEADILADRKAVLSKGKVQCIGSSLFLKSKYGLGYHLNIMTTGEAPVDKILELIRQFIPQAHFIKQMGTDLSYSLPQSESQSTVTPHSSLVFGSNFLLASVSRFPSSVFKD